MSRARTYAQAWSVVLLALAACATLEPPPSRTTAAAVAAPVSATLDALWVGHGQSGHVVGAYQGNPLALVGNVQMNGATAIFSAMDDLAAHGSMVVGVSTGPTSGVYSIDTATRIATPLAAANTPLNVIVDATAVAFDGDGNLFIAGKILNPIEGWKIGIFRLTKDGSGFQAPVLWASNPYLITGLAWDAPRNQLWVVHSSFFLARYTANGTIIETLSRDAEVLGKDLCGGAIADLRDVAVCGNKLVFQAYDNFLLRICDITGAGLSNCKQLLGYGSEFGDPMRLDFDCSCESVYATTSRGQVIRVPTSHVGTQADYAHLPTPCAAGGLADAHNRNGDGSAVVALNLEPGCLESGPPCAVGLAVERQCVTPECTVDSHCAPDSLCEVPKCVQGTCQAEPKVCNTPGPCETGPGTCSYDDGSCSYQQVASCTTCTSDAACSDNNACTTDMCTNGACVNTQVVCADGSACTGNGCPSGACVSLCGVADYNLFVLGNANVSNSDVEGRVGVGGNAIINGYSIGLKASPSAPNSLEVAGNLSIRNAQVFAGAQPPPLGTAVYGGTLDAVSATANFVRGDAGALSAFHQGQAACLAGLSATLAAAPTNCTTTVQYGGLYLSSSSPTGGVLYCAATAAALAGVMYVDLNGLQGGSSSTAIVLNVSGAVVETLGSLGFNFPAGLGPKNLLLNLHQANAATLRGSINGSILAPLAAVTTSPGQYLGNLIAGSYSGTGESHVNLLVGCPQTCGSCDDNNLCTTDTCANGACVNTPVTCTPQDACHAASCDPATGCANTAIMCSPKDACHTASCDPAVGCVNTPTANCCLSDDQCADNNACTTDTCANGACVNTPATCAPKDACHAASCDPATGCANTVITCAPKDACHGASCDPKLGCVNTPIANCCLMDSQCGDNNTCTTDACVNNVCKYTTKPNCCLADDDCHDGNACTTDACVNNVCTNTTKPNCCTMDSQCNDNNTCTTDACVNNVCTNTTKPNCCLADDDCHDGNACTTDACVNNVCTNTTKQNCCTMDSQCGDNNACTTDACVNNACTYTPKQNCCTMDSQCGDNNACTTDACVNNVCTNTPKQNCCTMDSQCGDNNACTTDACVNNVCTNTTKPNCCTMDSQCGDNNACTTDACVNNVCTNTTKPNCCTMDSQCGDNNACTTDACVNNVCTNTTKPNCCTMDSQCGDNNACTTDACVNNVCTNTTKPNCCTMDSQCGDNNACTTDACVNNVCTNTTKPNCCTMDSQCGDNNACTTDKCVNNVCTNTTKSNCCTMDSQCNDNNVCTTDTCVNNVCVNAPGNAGTVCRPACDKCDAEEKCDGQTAACPTDKAIVCNDSNQCTTDSCDPVKGCVYTPKPDTTPCDDGNSCTSPDMCLSGVCKGYGCDACSTPGCTPGYWKRWTSRWVFYKTSDKIKVPFPKAAMTEYGYGESTLLQGLSFQGGSTLKGAAQILLRAAIAGLLNYTKYGSAYAWTDTKIKSDVNAALLSKNRDTIIALASVIDGNNQFCH